MAQNTKEVDRLLEKYSTYSTTKKNMLVAMNLTAGMVSVASKQANIDRKTHYNWLKDDHEYATEIDHIREDLLDLVESKLLELINGAKKEVIISRRATEDDPRTQEIVSLRDKPDNISAIFFLKTKGKLRGYVEKQEIDFTGKLGYEPNIDLDVLSDEEKNLLAKIFGNQ